MCDIKCIDYTLGRVHAKRIHTQLLFQKHNDKELTLEGDVACNHCTKFMFQ
jgi:hypothetical protein